MIMDKNKEKRIATIGDLLGGTTALLKSTLSTDVLGAIVGSIGPMDDIEFPKAFRETGREET
jgi:hypothetical protein